MAATVLVLYPAEEDATFNMEYYKNKHMPLVQENFGPYGMKGYRVIKLHSTPDPSVASKFTVQAQLEFDTVENFHKALEAKASVVLGDVPNFSNKGPMLIIGDEVVPLTSK